MPETNITTKFRVDLSDLKKGISEANKQIKLANAEFKAAAAGMDDWESSTDGLRAKLSQLESVIAAQTSKLKSYQEQLERVEAAEKENQTRAEQLRTAYQKAATQYGKNSDEAKKLKSALNSVEKEQTNNAKSADDLRIKILNQTAEVRKSEQQFEKYEQALKDASKQQNNAADVADELKNALNDSNGAAKTAGDGFTVLKGALADLVADGFRMAIDAAKEFASQMIETAAEVKAQNSQYSQTFGEFESAATDAIGRVADNAGILDTRLKATGTQIYAFARTSGMEAPDALGLMERALQVTADQAAYYDRSLEDVSESLQSFLKGNYENDAALGLSATETTRNAAANELYGKSFNDLSEAQKQLTLLQMVEDANELSGALGQAARESDGWENVMGNLKETWRQFQANVGAPFLEELIPIIQNITTEFKNWTDSVDWGAFGEQVKSACDKVKDAIQTAFQFIVDHKDEIIGAVSAIVAGFMAFKTMTFLSGVATTIIAIVNAIKKAQTAMAAFQAVVAVLGGPVTLIIAGITALVAAFVYLWNTCEPFKQFWIDLGTTIANFASGAVDAIVNFFTVTIPEAFTSAMEWFQNLLSDIQEWGANLVSTAIETGSEFLNEIVTFFSELPGKVLEFITNVFNNVTEWASNMIAKAIELGTEFLDNILEFFSQLPYEVGYIIGDVLGKISKWVVDMIAKAKEVGTQFLNNIINFFSQLPGNVLNFITNTFNNVVEWGSNMIDKAIEVGTDFLNNIVNFFSQLPGRVLDFITNAFNNVVNWGSNMVSKAKEVASNFLNNIVNFFTQLPGKVMNFLTNTLNNVIQWGGDMVNRGREAASNLVSAVVDTVSSLPGKMLEIGSNLVTGLWNGITSAGGWLRDQISGFANGIIDGFKASFDIGSPSKVMADQVGKWLPAGLAEGIENNLKSVKKAVADMNGIVQFNGGSMNAATAGGTGMAGGRSITFNQYNTSPKPLSRLEIYRQTRNQLQLAKGVI